ncbi:MAG: PAN domain-containing protein [Xanthobacteraceae bacterium]
MAGHAGAHARRLVGLLATLLLILALPRAAEAQVNFDRPGGDYLRAPVASGDPVDCSLQCEHDRRCRAWSFSYPTTAAPEAMCVLKSSVPPRIGSTCCVSGVRGAGVVEKRTGAIEMSTDRNGGDYRSVDLKPTDSEEKCKEACEADGKCRAWTYARPGYIGKEARCFLKNQIKPPHRKPGFTSGVVR